MAIELSNHNLDFLMDEEENVTSFMRYLISDTKAIDTYYGEPYLFKSMGDAEFWIQTAIIEDNNLEAARFNSHGRGECVWNVINSGIDITPKDSPRLSKVALFTSTDEKGLVPIELVNADVLPSHLPHDKYTMQVVALPMEINYHATEDDYTNAQPEDKNGEKWLISDGSLFPVNFLYNHNPENYEQDRDYESDTRVLFRATVKQLYLGTVELEKESLTHFVRCIADTEFGELEFVHSFNQVPEDQQDNIKVGSIISGVCIVSGDVAIYDYKDGVVLNYDNDLKLVRHTIVKGEAERMKNVLADDAVYETDTYNKKYFGKKEIIDRFNEVHNAREDDYRAHLAVIIETDEENMEFSVGTRCLVLEDEEGEYESIVFITVNEVGKITYIRVCTDSRYHFQIETSEHEKTEV